MIDIFLTLLPRIVPLYSLVYLGYFAARNLEVEKTSFAKLSMYILVPLVMFHGVMNAGFSVGLLLVPIAIFGVSTAACFIVFYIARKQLPIRTQANILAMSSGTGNSGYFGLPVVMMLFDEKGVGVYLTTVLGMTIFQNTVGYYISSIGSYSAQESIKKLVKLPVIYAFLLAVFFNSLGLHMPKFMGDFFGNIRGAYIVIGMMIIGAGLAGIERLALNVKFTLLAFGGRYVVWPLVAFLVYFLDQALLGIFNEDIRRALVVASLVPLGADTVAIASILKCHPEEMATTVVLSSVFALFYIPFMIYLFL